MTLRHILTILQAAEGTAADVLKCTRHWCDLEISTDSMPSTTTLFRYQSGPNNGPPRTLGGITIEIDVVARIPTGS